MRRERIARVVIVGLVSVVLIGGAAPMAVLAEPEPGKRVETMLESLSDVLSRLEAELAALRAPAAERLEEGIEEIIELIKVLLRDFAGPQDEEETGARARILKLDLMLHWLVHVLEEIVENGEGSSRPKDGDALEGLRRWIDAYLDGMTVGMDRQAAARFERAVHEMFRDLGARLAQMAKQAQGNDGRVLGRLLERLEDLLFQLDAFILHNFGPSAEAHERP